MPGVGRPFEKGNPGGPGRPSLGQNLVKLADEAATKVVEIDLAVLEKPAKTKAAKLRRHQAMDRLSRMCKGRLPTRIAIAGDEGGEPVPISYVEVGTGIDVTPKPPEPKPVPKKKPRLKAKKTLHRLVEKKRRAKSK